MRVILLICLFAAATLAQMPKIEPGVSQELAKWRAVQYSNVSYKLNLTLEKMSPVLKGTIEIHVTQAAYACAEPNCPRPAIVLDWRKIPGHEKESTISNASINGTSVAGIFTQSFYVEGPPRPVYRYDDDHLYFENGVRMGENVIKLDFTSPILTSGSAVTRYIDKEDGSEYIYSLFVPSDASTAFPCFDQPDLKARFTLNLDIPNDWKAVGNNLYVAASTFYFPEEKDRRHSQRFQETKPISTYVFAFAAGPLKQFQYVSGDVMKSADETYFKRPRDPNSFTMNVHVRQSQAAKFQPHAKEVYRLTQEGVRYLETYFDYKFPFSKLDLVLIPEFPFGGMEHAGAIFLREDRVIFPAEPTKGDYLTRANLIFHETAHQWFGDTVTMRWFDDLWLKEGFAEFMAYKTLEKVMPDANAWKLFYERNKQAAYATDSTRGTTPIYQPIANLSAAKSAYGNIVYRKAPSFLRQAEFYLGEDKFQTAVRSFLKKHEFGNAGWEDLVGEFEAVSGKGLRPWANAWIAQRGAPTIRTTFDGGTSACFTQMPPKESKASWPIAFRVYEGFGRQRGISADVALQIFGEDDPRVNPKIVFKSWSGDICLDTSDVANFAFVFPNYQDYGYGIFLLDDKSRDYVLKNIQNEKDPFLRSMMWGALWDSVREAELDPKDYVELAIKNLGGGATGAEARASARAVRADSPTETDETTVASILGRVSTALNYYIPAPDTALANARASAKSDLQSRLEDVLLDRLQHAPTPGLRVTFYRAFVTNVTTEKGREVLKQMLSQGGNPSGSEGAQRGTPSNLRTLPTGRVSASTASMSLRTKDRFDIVTRLIVLGDPEAPKLLAGLEKTETSDDAKRYAYAAHAAFGTAENKAKFFNDFLSNKNISESWIESAIMPFNSISHAELTQQYLERSLKELPNLKRTRKIFFINNWLAAWIGGQRDEKALDIVNKFLADNPSLDNDLRLKILENVDLIERAVKIRKKYR